MSMYTRNLALNKRFSNFTTEYTEKHGVFDLNSLRETPCPLWLNYLGIRTKTLEERW